MVEKVAEKVRARGLAFNMTMDHSLVVMKMDILDSTWLCENALLKSFVQKRIVHGHVVALFSDFFAPVRNEDGTNPLPVSHRIRDQIISACWSTISIASPPG
jgi:hypothetical protein